ncbi:MAG: hypothetical protein ACRCY9_02040, partial [Phycicoccus sp.]
MLKVTAPLVTQEPVDGSASTPLAGDLRWAADGLDGMADVVERHEHERLRAHRQQIGQEGPADALRRRADELRERADVLDPRPKLPGDVDPGYTRSSTSGGAGRRPWGQPDPSRVPWPHEADWGTQQPARPDGFAREQKAPSGFWRSPGDWSPRSEDSDTGFKKPAGFRTGDTAGSNGASTDGSRGPGPDRTSVPVSPDEWARAQPGIDDLLRYHPTSESEAAAFVDHLRRGADGLDAFADAVERQPHGGSPSAGESQLAADLRRRADELRERAGELDPTPRLPAPTAADENLQTARRALDDAAQVPDLGPDADDRQRADLAGRLDQVARVLDGLADSIEQDPASAQRDPGLVEALRERGRQLDAAAQQLAQPAGAEPVSRGLALPPAAGEVFVPGVWQPPAVPGSPSTGSPPGRTSPRAPSSTPTPSPGSFPDEVAPSVVTPKPDAPASAASAPVRDVDSLLDWLKSIDDALAEVEVRPGATWAFAGSGPVDDLATAREAVVEQIRHQAPELDLPPVPPAIPIHHALEELALAEANASNLDARHPDPTDPARDRIIQELADAVQRVREIQQRYAGAELPRGMSL